VRTLAVTLPPRQVRVSRNPLVKGQVSFYRSGTTTTSNTFQTGRIPERHFSATLGEEPEVELALL
jgi:hypothetical protein